MADAGTRLVAHLLRRPTLRRRGRYAYLTVRSWRADTRSDDIAAFRREKRVRTRSLLDLAGSEIAEEVTALLHPTADWCVTAVAPGHSRDPESWGVLLAAVVADQLRLPFRTAFRPRPVPGTSHPRRNLMLPPLEWDQRPTGPVILVDDIATSGWHMAEALDMLSRSGVAALGAAWISGTVRRPIPALSERDDLDVPDEAGAGWSAGTAD